MFQINDTVLYGSDGVCKITGMMDKEFGGKRSTYYVLKPVYNSATIYVPTDNQALLGKMRRVLSPEEISHLIESMPDEAVIWYEDETERKEKFKEILLRGDRVELVKIIKALYQHQMKQQEKGKRLHVADERIFKEAERMLYDEFALVLNLEPDQVLGFIMDKIKVEEKPREHVS